jgi:hypothetical protein
MLIDTLISTLTIGDNLGIDVKTIEKARKNHPYSLFIIGEEYYRKGLLSNAGNTSDWFRKAHTWYKKAADESYPDAQFNLGYMYEHCIGVKEQDYNLAIEYYILAATLGYTSAFYRLGYIYEKGIGVTENMEEAFVWYEKAAEQGDVFAQFKIGSMYKSGKGVSMDCIKALTWFTCCANQGDRDAQTEVAELEKQGYSLEEKIVRKPSKKNKPISRNNSVYRQHQQEREMEKEQRRLSTLSQSSYYDCVEFSKPHTRQANPQSNYQKPAQHSPRLFKPTIIQKPNLKDDVVPIKTKSSKTKIRCRMSKEYVDDDDCDRDLNLDDELPENDIYYDGK